AVTDHQQIARPSPGSMDVNTETLRRRQAQAAEHRPIMVLRAPSLSPASLAHSIVRLFHYRDLLLTLSLHRLKVRYKQSVLGPSWAVLQPVALMVIYTVIF